MKAQISEIFQSVQGEGKYVGIKQVFVRFSECNMNCAWCDTPSVKDRGDSRSKEYSVEEVLVEVMKMCGGCHSVSLTGGEPLLQKDFLKELLRSFRGIDMRRYLETNGILHEALAEVLEDVDIIAMDIKLPSSTGQPPFWQEHEKFLRSAMGRDIFVKAVVSKATQQEDILRMIELIGSVNPAVTLILQPVSQDLDQGAVEKCCEYQNICLKELSDVRIIPQMHKILGIR